MLVAKERVVRKRRSVTMAEIRRGRHGGVSTRAAGGIPGYSILRPNVRAELLKPDYNKDPFPSVGHIVPPITAIDANGRKVPKRFEAYRDGHDAEGLMHWFVVLDVVKNVGIGDDAKTFIANDPLDDSTDVAATPYAIMYRRIISAVKEFAATDRTIICGSRRVNPASWAALLPNNATSFKDHAFARPGSLRTGFVQWLPLYDRKRVRIQEGRISGAGEGDPAYLMMLSGSAMQTLKDAACAATSENPTGTDWAASYVYGDFTRMDGEGKFCVIYNAQYHVNAPMVLNRELPGAIRDAEEQEFDPSGPSAQAQKQEFAQYSVEFVPKVRLPSLDGRGTALYSERKIIGAPGVASQVLANCSEIYDYFHLPSYDEQAKLLAMAFRSRPELIVYGWSDAPQFMTDEVKAILNQRTQVATPGNSQDEYDVAANTKSSSSSIYDDEDEAALSPQTTPDKGKGKRSPTEALVNRASQAAGLYDDDDDVAVETAVSRVSEVFDDADAAFGQEEEDLSIDAMYREHAGDAANEEEVVVEDDDDADLAEAAAAAAAAKALQDLKAAKAARAAKAAKASAAASAAAATRTKRPLDGLPE